MMVHEKRERAVTIYNSEIKRYIELSVPYNNDFIKSIEADIPVGSRAWNGEKKRWIVDKKYSAVVEVLLRKYYDDISYTVHRAGDDPKLPTTILRRYNPCPPETSQGMITT
jgi:hypothetical protein